MWGRIHYASCTIPNDRALASGVPDTANGAGHLVARENYYRGAQINVYGGTRGVPQSNVIDASSPEGVFSLVHRWSPIPEGSLEQPLMYEVLPTIPFEHEQLYAVEVAIRISPRRHNEQWMSTVESTQKRLWGACLSHFQIATIDRAPTAMLPPLEPEVDPYAHYSA